MRIEYEVVNIDTGTVLATVDSLSAEGAKLRSVAEYNSDETGKLASGYDSPRYGAISCLAGELCEALAEAAAAVDSLNGEMAEKAMIIRDLYE